VLRSESCCPATWPKSRECAIELGQCFGADDYFFEDGTGTWCGNAEGNFHLELEEATAYCASTSSCVGVVFNAAAPGDQGDSYGPDNGKYTICTKAREVGTGWQVLLKPVHISATTACCLPDTWPKSRECAIQLGQCVEVGKYFFEDGTGTWCGQHDGTKHFELEEAMTYCASTSSCVGVVFNAAAPGDRGDTYALGEGKYTICEKAYEVGSGWQVLLKPVLGEGGPCGEKLLALSS